MASLVRWTWHISWVVHGNKGTTQHRRRTCDEDIGTRRMDDSYHPLLERRTTPRRHEWSMEGTDQSYSLHRYWRYLIQTRTLPPLSPLWQQGRSYVLQVINEGICSKHAEARSLTGKALRVGYYWLTLQKDTYDLIKAYDQCQCFTNVQT